MGCRLKCETTVPTLEHSSQINGHGRETSSMGGPARTHAEGWSYLIQQTQSILILSDHDVGVEDDKWGPKSRGINYPPSTCSVLFRLQPS